MRERLGDISGRQWGRSTLPAGTGITPAYAGKTSGIRCFGCDFEDHPRVCGKDRKVFALTIIVLGSPPRMRERHNPSK